MPKVSIIICSYNRGELIKRAIESVISQSFSDFEIIVIDDASSDNTEQIVRSMIQKDVRTKYFKNDNNLGISKSRNKGVSLSEGKYIAMLDSDDLWIDKEKLQKQVKILDGNPEIGLIGSAIRCIDKGGNKIKDDLFETEDIKIREKILSKNQFAQSSVTFRRDIFEKAGRYDEKLEVCEDLDLWLRIGNICKFANLSEITAAYTIHSEGISKSKKLKIATTTDKTIERYKKDYPNYLVAKIKSLTRILLAHF